MEMSLSNGWNAGWNGWNSGWPQGWLLEQVFGEARPGPEQAAPAAEVVEDADAYRFYFEMPGVKADSLEVKLEDGTLTVAAERTRPEYPKDATLHRSERQYGQIYRAFRLPEHFAHEPVSANYHDGVLEVVIAKPAQAKPVKIAVNCN